MARTSIVCQIVQEAQMYLQTDFLPYRSKDNLPNAPDQLPQILIRPAVDIRSTFAQAHGQFSLYSPHSFDSANPHKTVKSSWNPSVALTTYPITAIIDS